MSAPAKREYDRTYLKDYNYPPVRKVVGSAWMGATKAALRRYSVLACGHTVPEHPPGVGAERNRRRCRECRDLILEIESQGLVREFQRGGK